ncbi:MAG: DUF2797 domain-containing protein [Bacteroidetes bacterium]|jgi:hypothetical protein|nr:DUF2797 domain-containing protein [Flavobacteriaceae bacterium]MBT6127402.1 DUF2797 domain-containing protein [Flavobacteriaceae bacterium]MDG1028887.1 DUF2797 domain-containing protein [Flavobacteriaceae bacterium]NCF31027.1 DUF2797 domain-containing protein [Bacteroidota bacterium]|tara:strand:+ start:1452 stop:2237 length:786 start_codon:yes stop_codon:yes gene_type:complete
MFKGVLKKMITEMGAPIRYFLNLENDFLEMNQFLDQKIKMEFTGTQCLSCHASKPIFRQGFCKSCFFEIPSAGDWVMRPELSKAHLGEEDRDLEYEKKVQLQPHAVYLALSSHLKVGVTRKSQIPTRWIDQGAHQAVAILEVPNRYLAGVAEVSLKEYFSDKTNWRKMLQNDHEEVSWQQAINQSIDGLPKDLKPYITKDSQLTEIQFPVLQYPEKVKSLNLEKESSYTGVLKGIKGQYLIFEDQTVFNVRSNEGLVVSIN